MIKLVLCTGVLLLAACGETQVQKKNLVADQYTKTPPHHTKPGAALALINSQVNLAVAGVEYSINVGINSGYDYGEMSLSVSSSEGLYIVGGDTHPTITLHKGSVDYPLDVMATEPGRYYIYINARVARDDKTQFRALTFIVQVGEEAKVNNAYHKKSNAESDKEYIIPMKAKEEVIY